MKRGKLACLIFTAALVCFVPLAPSGPRGDPLVARAQQLERTNAVQAQQPDEGNPNPAQPNLSSLDPHLRHLRARLDDVLTPVETPEDKKPEAPATPPRRVDQQIPVNLPPAARTDVIQTPVVPAAPAQPAAAVPTLGIPTGVVEAAVNHGVNTVGHELHRQNSRAGSTVIIQEHGPRLEAAAATERQRISQGVSGNTIQGRRTNLNLNDAFLQPFRPAQQQAAAVQTLQGRSDDWLAPAAEIAGEAFDNRRRTSQSPPPLQPAGTNIFGGHLLPRSQLPRSMDRPLDTGHIPAPQLSIPATRVADPKKQTFRPGGVLMRFDDALLAQIIKKQGEPATLAEIEALEDSLIQAGSLKEAFLRMRAFQDGKATELAEAMGKQRQIDNVRIISLTQLGKKLGEYRKRWQDRPPELKNLAGLTRIHGFQRDPSNGDLLLVGRAEPDRTPIRVDDLIVGLRSVWHEGVTPGCSLDPNPTSFTAPHMSRIIGVPQDCSFAKIMLDADYAMKLVMGKEPKNVLDIRGYKTLPDYLAAGNWGGGRFVSRFWLFPVQPGPREIQLGPAGMSALFEARVQVLTEEMALSSIGMTGTGKANPFCEQAAQSFTAHYDEIAKARPIFYELNGLFDIVLMGKLLRMVAPDDPLLKTLVDLPYEKVDVPKSYAALTLTHKLGGGLTLIMQGGCDARLRLRERSLIEARTKSLVKLGDESGKARLKDKLSAELPKGALALPEQTADQRKDAEAELAFSYASQLLAEEKYADAIAKLSEAIAVDDSFAEAYALRGLAQLRLGQRRAAFLDGRAAIDLAPREVPVRALVVQILYEGGDKGVLKDMDPSTQSELGDHYLRMVFVQLSKKHVDMAVKVCSQAIEVNPKKGDAYSVRAAIRVFQRDFAGADKDAALAIQLGGKDLLSQQLRPLRTAGGSPEAALGKWGTTMIETLLLMLSGGPGPGMDLVAALDADDYFRSRRLDPSIANLRKWAKEKPADGKEHLRQLLAIRKLAELANELKRSGQSAQVAADLKDVHATQTGFARKYAEWALARVTGDAPPGAKAAPERLRDSVLWFPRSPAILGAVDLPAFTANAPENPLRSFVQMLHMILFERDRENFYQLVESVGNIGIDRQSFAVIVDPRDPNQAQFMVRVTGQVDRNRLLSILRDDKKMAGEVEIDEKKGPGSVTLTYFRFKAGKNSASTPVLVLVDDTDLLIVGSMGGAGGDADQKDAQAIVLEALKRRAEMDAKVGNWEAYLKNLEPQTAGFVAVELPDKLREMLAGQGNPFGAFPRRLTVDMVRTQTALNIRAQGKMQNEKEAQSIREKAQPLLAMGHEFLKKPEPGQTKRMLEVAKKTLESIKIDAAGAEVEVRLQVPGDCLQLAFLIHNALDQIEEEAKRAEAIRSNTGSGAKSNPREEDEFISRENLRVIAKGLHAHHSAYKRLPPAAIVDKDGKPLLSWRVAILPFIGHEKLYEEFKLNEPWDSKHNIKLLSRMPDVYTPIGVKTKDEYATFYQVFNGPTAVIFDSSRIRLADITDGLSNTIAVVEAREAVPWTKPGDLAYGDKNPLPAVGGGQFAGGFHAAMMDGSIHFFLRTIADDSLRALITRAGNEVVDIDKLTRAEKR